MTDDSERRTTQDETTPRFGRRWDWESSRRAEELTRSERAELVSQREKEADETRREVGAIAKCEEDTYCAPMNLQPDDPRCQPRPVQQQRRGSHVVGGYGRNR